MNVVSTYTDTVLHEVLLISILCVWKFVSVCVCCLSLFQAAMAQPIQMQFRMGVLVFQKERKQNFALKTLM